MTRSETTVGICEIHTVHMSNGHAYVGRDD